MRRAKVTFIYRQTKNLRPVQLLLGHTKLESTVRYVGIEGNDALEIAEYGLIQANGLLKASVRQMASERACNSTIDWKRTCVGF